MLPRTTSFMSVFIALIICSSSIIAQHDHHTDTIYPQMVNVVNPTIIGEHLRVLASDDFDGRETGHEGNNRAAAYLARHIADYGLEPIDQDKDYLQPFYVSKRSWGAVSITSGDTKFKHLRDFIAPHWSNGEVADYTIDDLYFVGYGIETKDFSNYGKADIKDKVIMMYAGEPMDEMGNYVLSGTTEAGEWSNDFKKIALARRKGAKGVLLIDPNFKETLEKNRRFLVGPMISSQESGEEISDNMYAVIHPGMAKTLLGKKIKKATKMRMKNSIGRSTRPIKIRTDLRIDFKPSIEALKTQNVVGMVPGSNPSMSDKAIIVTAHYDHLGRRGDDIFNGADDNGSGTSTLLAMAEAVQQGVARGLSPQRPIVFLWVSGEEKGLLGSAYYVDHPLLPLENHMVNVNVDMIGRQDEHHDDDNYVYVIGADRLSTTLHEVNEKINQQYMKIDLDYTYNAEDDPNRYYYRSDHYNFAKQDIPAIFFFSGVHKDYHRPSDTYEKINLNKTSRIGQHILHLIYELANREAPIEVNVK